ncbi:sulfotransferase family 2 domain-containing protein [Tropicimonas sp. TH_r6]|uniref:sulfotransferase family 2 domain-containing protein n=1 Tax=Tropicimonas sp. TH_r6 TaxID=3082085 RepID=UPI00295435FC|nr:sulfotransferase family 2 domain-containing protein [Tropicimonas sp. TH_r6]MDV7145713.1 sulfotransferase family 2 domain-containing protein [Tropicimonas sp. TH_r6]
MLISFPFKFIYIKTNKTASTSIEMALQPFCQEDASTPIEEKLHTIVSDVGIVGQRLVPKSEANELDRYWYNHMPASELKSKVGEHVWDSFTKIHAIRNPFDKVLSSFF